MEMVHYYLFECGKGRVGYDWFSHLQETEWYDPKALYVACLLYTSPSPRDRTRSRMPSSA